MLVGALLMDLQQPLDLQPSELDSLVTLLANALVFTVLMQAKGLSYRELFHGTPARLTGMLVLLLPPLLLVLPGLILVATASTDLLTLLLPLSRWEEEAFARMSADNVAAIVGTCILAPVLEEMLFRGIILRAFLLQYPRWTAITGSALLFGFAHFNIYQFVVAFMLGTLAGWLYERTRSLAPCIALHAGYNGLLVLAGQADPNGTDSTSPGAWLMALAAAAIGLLLLHGLLRGRRPPA